ncbi:LamG-like jellyroll fold domain-containing protein [Paenibacillus aceris]|uniref:non-reducing end alpha-L-arabinofuranosidase n=1 Tax=Paenibacillus aceris TaxID=869555 RepID=A0ABS4I737_9BACL|nr:LamG-like jellyroll fold domain-containing protein [Paenibacillus aceris]MBP1966739.1 alpha-L-arabinofuranosidase [Paenibacillus aceris]NHW35001.1 DUF1080 domain-containing protein [Paenibacillus aceris]
MRLRTFKKMVGFLGMMTMMSSVFVSPVQGSSEDTNTNANMTISAVSTVAEDSLLLHYKFDQTSGTTVEDASNKGHSGTLMGGATWNTEGKIGGAVTLNGTNGYIKLPDGILADQNDVTIATWVKVNTIKTWGRVFDFGSGTSNWTMLTLKNGSGFMEFSTTPEGGSKELVSGPAFPTSKIWQHVAVVKKGNKSTMYINGIEVASTTTMPTLPSVLGNTTQNYIGKSQYADPYFDGGIDDFRIYNRALEGNEVMGLAIESMSNLELVAYSKNWLNLGDTSKQTQNLSLPTSGPGGTSVTWQTSDASIVKTDGTVTQPAAGQGDKSVTLTATISKGDIQDTKSFTVVVWESGSTAYTMNINGSQPAHDVSPTLYGIFFEDINYSADGGLYGELVQNRSFEFDSPLYAWNNVIENGGAGQVTTAKTDPLNAKNPNYVRLSVTKPGAGVGISNSGYDGIAVKSGESYHFSVYTRSSDSPSKSIAVQLRGQQGTVYDACTINGITSQWQKLDCSLKAKATDTKASIVVMATDAATVDLDMVSLFPETTWGNRSNGLRYDLAEMLDDLHPGFLRFPGGCIVEGGSLQNRYQWKNTIGDVNQRQIQHNQWASNYYQSFGLGFHEYFQLAEDIGAEPLPLLFIGQVSCTATPPMIPLGDLQPYIQDALDLIEYANGDVTTKWGAARAANGHPEPFHLKYLGLGNELWGQNYLDRYNIFYDAIKAKYPEMKLVLSAGAYPDDANFDLAYNWLGKNGQKADLVDEHMYQSPQWFYNNVNRYDKYSRTGPKVFVGEYAAHGSGKRNNMESALAEGAFMTGLERNSDVVGMASFAPLFAYTNRTQWTTDLIWFNNHEVFGTPNYYVQQMFKNHLGQKLMPTELTKRNQPSSDVTGSIVLGSWSTAVDYDNVKVTSADHTELLNNDFTDSATLSQWNNFKGTWAITGGLLKQTDASATDARLQLLQGQNWSNYTLELKARKVSGAEGFLVGFGNKDSNNYYWWNLGGFGNTKTVIEKAVNGTKTTISNTSTKTITANQWYDIKVVVEGNRIRCYLDGELIHDITDNTIPGPLYSVTTKDETTGDLIVKVVNISGEAQSTQVNVSGAEYIQPEATVIELKSASSADENSYNDPTNVFPVTKKVSGFGKSFSYSFPAYSLSVIRLRTTSAPVIDSIDNVNVHTSIGSAPQLPAVVTVTKSDGSKQNADVEWKRVDEDQYATVGTFEVKGIVAGTYLNAYATVQVAEKKNENPAAVLTGPSSVEAGSSVDLTYGFSDVTESVYANDITVNYDPNHLEYVSADSLVEGIQVVGNSEPGNSGKVRILAANTGAAVSGTVQLLKLHFKAKSVSETTSSTVTLSDVIIANSSGAETNLNSGDALALQITVNDTVDKTALLNLIAAAQQLHDAAQEGSLPGEYPAGAKAALFSAIAKAQGVAADAGANSQAVNAAIGQLEAAIQVFKASVVTAQTGDLNADGRFSIGDLAIVASSYGKTKADPDWNTLYKKSDFNGDGIIDIVDLAAVAKLIIE